MNRQLDSVVDNSRLKSKAFCCPDLKERDNCFSFFSFTTFSHQRFYQNKLMIYKVIISVVSLQIFNISAEDTSIFPIIEAAGRISLSACRKREITAESKLK